MNVNLSSVVLFFNIGLFMYCLPFVYTEGGSVVDWIGVVVIFAQLVLLWMVDQFHSYTQFCNESLFTKISKDITLESLYSRMGAGVIVLQVGLIHFQNLVVSVIYICASIYFSKSYLTYLGKMYSEEVSKDLED